MRRRDFIAFAGASGGTFALPSVLRAQRARIPRVAYIYGSSTVTDLNESSTNPNVAAFFREMTRQGFVDGQTVIYDRYASDASNANDVGSKIVRSAPDLVFAAGATTTVLAIMGSTMTIPIVSVSPDPLAERVVNSLTHPGRNVTAIATTASADSEGKILTLLAQTVPTARRIAYFSYGAGGQISPAQAGNLQSAADTALRIGISLATVIAPSGADTAAVREAFSRALAAGAQAFQFGRSTENSANSVVLAGLTIEARLPGIAPYILFAQSGGLLSYGSNIPDNIRKGAVYAATILRGGNPADLPVLQPTLFDFAINLRTSKLIGVAVPESILIQATEVIQ